MVNSADTDVVGDTNGDGVADEADTGLVGDANGDGVVDDQDAIIGGDVNQDGVVDAEDAGESTPPERRPMVQNAIAQWLDTWGGLITEYPRQALNL